MRYSDYMASYEDKYDKDELNSLFLTNEEEEI